MCPFLDMGYLSTYLSVPWSASWSILPVCMSVYPCPFFLRDRDQQAGVGTGDVHRRRG